MRETAPKKGDEATALRPVELLCLEDNTTQVNSSVAIDVPLFRPYPTEVHFRDYEPFSRVEKTLRFRNSDRVARRIKVLPPKSPYFEVSGPRAARGKDGAARKQSKVATGMEVCFVVTFRPQEVREHARPRREQQRREQRRRRRATVSRATVPQIPA